MPQRERVTGTTPADPVISQVERVYQRLRDAVVSGEYAPGTPLRPARLSSVYGVSLIPIREALRKLEVERLVESSPNKGARVTPISAVDLLDVYDTRMVLEVEALARAWPHMDAAFVARLRELRERMVAANRSGEGARAHDIHRRIHFTIYGRAESPWLLHLIEILWNHTERYRRLVARVATFLDDDHDLHGAVLDAIATNDLDEASDALRRDLARTRDLILASETEVLGIADEQVVADGSLA